MSLLSRITAATSRLADSTSGALTFPRAAGLLLLFYAVSTAFFLARYDFNPSALIRFGHYYIEQNQAHTPAGAIRLLGDETHGGNGYDGQIFYYYARTLFLPGVWPEGFNNAYRAPRLGFPLLAAPFVVFGSWGVVFGLILAQLGFLLAGLWALLRLLPDDRRYLAVFWIVSPFSLQSFLLLVSDSVVAGLMGLGYYFFTRVDPEREGDTGTIGDWIGAFLCFALAILTKESSLFLLFPLGLLALTRLDWKRALLMMAILLPMVAWQAYLRTAHGMIPAGVLSIFLSPLDGVIGLAGHTFVLLGEFLAAPGGGPLMALIKHGVKVVLFLLIPTALVAVFTGNVRSFLPFRLATLFTLASVLIADWYYFWSVYENISRMFTVIVPIVILLKAQDARAHTASFFAVLGLLAFLVFIRTAAITPRFDYDTFQPYSGPNYSEHVIVPGTLQD